MKWIRRILIVNKSASSTREEWGRSLTYLYTNFICLLAMLMQDHICCRPSPTSVYNCFNSNWQGIPLNMSRNCPWATKLLGSLQLRNDLRSDKPGELLAYSSSRRSLERCGGVSLEIPRLLHNISIGPILSSTHIIGIYDHSSNFAVCYLVPVLFSS